MRKFKRVSVDSIGYAIDDKHHLKISIQDFSRMGISFLCSKSYAINSFISILYQNENNQILKMKIYVKNTSRTKDYIYRIGAAFVGIESRS